MLKGSSGFGDPLAQFGFDSSPGRLVGFAEPNALEATPSAATMPMRTTRGMRFTVSHRIQ